MVSGIVENVRDFLADTDATRWSDMQLIRLIDRAQKDIALKSHTLRAKYRFGIRDGQAVYELPDDVIRITRVTVNDDKFGLRSHEDLDELVGSWEAQTGSTIEAIIFDKLSEGYIKTYPIVEGSNEITYQLGNDYGLISDLGTDIHGVLSGADDAESEIVNNGTTTEIISGTLVLTVYYIKRARTISSINDEIELDDVWTKAIEHYVQGHALRNDKDTVSRGLGNEELALYEKELKTSKKISSLDFTMSTQYETSYRRGV